MPGHTLKNKRAKGLRIERLAVDYAKSLGYDLIRIYQPRGQPQVCDLILLGYGRIRFVEVRYGSWRLARSRELQLLNRLHCQRALSGTCELWRFQRGETQPRQRVLE